ncbi:hypothetical protein VNO80_19633 [Phaseolus coccineus]|uniref:Uncharacterized protein n=1 Tax=Phaseolus coccineus TaxID=3886 RepID=A0AAN9MJV4_PHACN
MEKKRLRTTGLRTKETVPVDLEPGEPVKSCRLILSKTLEVDRFGVTQEQHSIASHALLGASSRHHPFTEGITKTLLLTN